jgi:CDP-diacylglycerol--serine O-phosphatidyltransferase
MPPKELDFDGADPILSLDVLPSSSLKRRFRRGIRVLPSIFTVANLMCGCYVVRVVVDGNRLDYDNAACAIWIAWVFDALDGALARAMGSSSAFGKEFDSLADIITFGLAPIFLAYVWGLRPMGAAISQNIASSVEISWIIGLFYIVSCAWRLARFNLQVTKPGENRFFVGMPAPAGALLVAALVHYVGRPLQDLRSSWLLLLLLVVLALLMLSSVRHYSFKDIRWMRRQPSLTVVLVTLLLAAIVHFSRIALLAIAGTYVCHGVALQLVRFTRHRKVRSRGFSGKPPL